MKTGRLATSMVVILWAALLGFAWLVLVRPFFHHQAYYLPSGPTDPYGFNWLLVLISLPYLGACFIAVREPDLLPPSRLLWAAFLTTSTLLVFAPPLQSHDLYQYLFYGKLAVVYHANPYLVPPAAHSSDPWFRYISWPDTRSEYGPAWIALMSLVVWLTRGSISLAIVLEKGVCFLAAVSTTALFRLLPRQQGEFGHPELGVLVFGLSPLVLSSGALGGHADALVCLGLVGAMVADSRHRPNLTAALLALATLVKLYALIPLAVYLLARLIRTRGRAVGSIALALCVLAGGYLPYWSGLRTISPVVAAGGRVSSSLAGTVQMWLTSLLRALGVSSASGVATSIVDALGVLVISLTALHLVRARHIPRSVWTACAILLGTFFLVTPWYLPWYLVSLLALVSPLSARFLLLTVTGFGVTSLVQVPDPTGISRTAFRYLLPPVAAWRFLSKTRVG
jgi:hypothetical protein